MLRNETKPNALQAGDLDETQAPAGFNDERAHQFQTPQRRRVIVGLRGLPGDLVLPDQARGLVVFAHSSGSSRTSARNRAVAEVLQRRQMGTLLFDLLTESEAALRSNVFQIPQLAARLLDALDWISVRPDLNALPLGLFGASTGAAAALVAAAARPQAISVVVSRGGRPDLAVSALSRVQAPTLLVVGAADEDVLALNRVAFAHLRCCAQLAVIPGATHMFEEPGALDQVAALASDWFSDHLLEHKLC
jgi:pimeloyl-ACP methyl ester carboxylesterase